MHRRECSVIDITVPHRRRNPSFSSTLIDVIYRSVDDSGNGDEPSLCHYREKTGANPVKKQGSGSMEKASSLKRAIMIEKWIEKQGNYGSAVDSNSVSSSSGSSNGGIFSSSEAESRRSKPDKNNKQEGGGGFTKTKLKALKIYDELKKVKQPISPGGWITSFLNSIFNADAKKVKMCSDGVSGDVNFRRKSKSTASSPTSFSRSCLSKTPCSRGNNNNKYGVVTVFRLVPGIGLRLRKIWIGVATDNLFKNKWVDRIPYFLHDLRLTRNMSGSGVGYG
ncbi:BREVIS RADIX-like 4 isoform 1 [Hibiscus syriacus]|uniref:BREVIS RADIX-like 4 isoform 1 n=1 Tax=Hibiscus syriacus TaxID=106335 RepID=A0A6A3D149_HIBSY|nr:BREVIS RADIX-like 4 isoform 1 [Hibiscus syriacus]